MRLADPPARRARPRATRVVPRDRRARVSAGGPADVESMSVDERKGALIRLCANSDRGKSATPEAAAAIETLVRSLEAVNPTRDPAVAPGITGKWSLLYTGASAEDAAKRAELEGALGSTLTEVTGSSGNVALATYFQSGDAEAATARDGGKPLGRAIGTLSPELSRTRATSKTSTRTLERWRIAPSWRCSGSRSRCVSRLAVSPRRGRRPAARRRDSSSRSGESR